MTSAPGQHLLDPGRFALTELGYTVSMVTEQEATMRATVPIHVFEEICGVYRDTVKPQKKQPMSWQATFALIALAAFVIILPVSTLLYLRIA